MTNVAPLTVSPDLHVLLDRHLSPPYRSHGRLAPPGALEKLTKRRTQRLLESEDAFIVVARQGPVVSGGACWIKLPWDSEQFGFPGARLEFLVAQGDYFENREIKRRLLNNVLDDCRRHGIVHLATRVDAGDLSTIHALEGAGFELIDGIQTFAFPFYGEPLPPSPSAADLQIRQFQEPDLEQILAIARSAYVFDRFHADPALSGETADRINEAWLRNSCLGQTADAVIVACEGPAVLGYVTCKIDREAVAVGIPIGTIVMVATAQEARGRGVAKAATNAALHWFRGNGISIVEVGTQLRNLPASRLYETCGFRLCATSLTFRRSLA